MSIRHFICCCLVIATSWHPLVAQESALAWKFNVGDQHRYRMTLDMEMEMSLGTTGRKVTTSVGQILDLTWTVAEVDAQGQAKVLQSIDRLQMDMRAPGQQKMHYDSQSEAAPSGFAAMLSPLAKAILTNPLELTITPRGEIKDVEVPEDVAGALKAIPGVSTLGGKISVGGAETLKAIPGGSKLGDIFSVDGFRSMVRRSLHILPDSQELSPDTEWTSESQTTSAQLGAMETELKYRYVGTREVASVPYDVFSVSATTEFSEAPTGVQLDVVGQESSGEVLFNREQGRLESSELQQTIELNLSSGDQAIRQKLVQKTTFKLIED